MPRVTRRRTIAGPRARGLGAGLRPLQPAALVAADGPGRERRAQGGGRRSQWTKVLETAEGRGVRADYRCLSSAEGERYVWEQQLEGTPFERHLRSSRIEIAPARGRRRDRGRPQLGADAAGHVAARLADDAPRPGRDPRRGARRDRAGAGGRVTRCSERRRAARLEVVGVGGPGGRAGARRARRWRCCASGSASWSRGRWRAELEELRAAARPSRCRAALIDAVGRGERSSPRPRTGSATRPAAATPTWRGCAAAGSRRRPTPSCCPPTPSRCAACSRSAPPRASPSSPSAAAPASSAGSSRCAGAHERLISLDLGAPARRSRSTGAR